MPDNSDSVSLSVPAFNTREIAEATPHDLRHLFRPQHVYKKADVPLHRLYR